MAGARDVKRRIKSVENTRQITRTMELVATSKLKRATDRVSSARPYAEAHDEAMWSTLRQLLGYSPRRAQARDARQVAVLVLHGNLGGLGLREAVRTSPAA